MGKERELPVIQEEQEQADDCCTPACGPTTCEPGAEAVEAKVVEAKAVEEPMKASSGCGPATCS